MTVAARAGAWARALCAGNRGEGAHAAVQSTSATSARATPRRWLGEEALRRPAGRTLLATNAEIGRTAAECDGEGGAFAAGHHGADDASSPEVPAPGLRARHGSARSVPLRFRRRRACRRRKRSRRLVPRIRMRRLSSGTRSGAAASSRRNASRPLTLELDLDRARALPAAPEAPPRCARPRCAEREARGVGLEATVSVARGECEDSRAATSFSRRHHLSRAGTKSRALTAPSRSRRGWVVALIEGSLTIESRSRPHPPAQRAAVRVHRRSAGTRAQSHASPTRSPSKSLCAGVRDLSGTGRARWGCRRDRGRCRDPPASGGGGIVEASRSSPCRRRRRYTPPFLRGRGAIE